MNGVLEKDCCPANFDKKRLKQYSKGYRFKKSLQEQEVMRETTANRFRKQLKPEVDRCIENHEVLRVIRRNGENFVVLGEEDWEAIAETIYLNQFPEL